MFKDFKKINYPLYIDNELIFNKSVVDITSSYIISQNSSSQEYIFQYYELDEYETAMDVSLKLYNTPKYYWIIFLINNIMNPYTDWYMDTEKLKRYVSKKYKSDILHFEVFLNSYYNGSPNRQLFEKIKTNYGENYTNSQEYQFLMQRFNEASKIYLLKNIEKIHHFKDITFDEERIVSDFESAEYFNNINDLPVYIVPVTNFEYEYEINLKKKIIKVITGDQLKLFIKDIKDILK